MGIEIDLIFVRESESTWFLCGGRKRPGFRVGVGKDLASVVEIDFGWVHVWHK